MTRRFAWLLVLCLAVAGCGANDSADKRAEPEPARPASRAPAPAPAEARVRIETELGAIVVALDGRHAPLTTANFLAYADQHRFDGTSFYRAARTRNAQGRGFIQGGIHRNYRLMLPPVAHEPTSRTGLSHGVGAISMARSESGSTTGEFFITASAMPAMDAHGGDPGYAAFGRVVEGMDVVQRILAAPTAANAGRGAMRGQMIDRPVRILTVRRIG